MKTTNRMKFIKTATLSLGTLVGVALGSHESQAAAVFTPNDQPPGYIAPMALSVDCIMVNCVLASGSINTSGGGKGYRPWFENGAWQGDLIQYSVTANGDMTTSIDLTTTTPTNSGANWSARMLFDSKVAASATWWTDTDTTGRKIITTNGGVQKAFRWDQLSTTQKAALDAATAAAGPSPVLSFVRGDRTLEKSTSNPTGTYRQRYNLLGDIMHSPPQYVAAPSASYGFGSYSTFKTSNANRAARVYVGANDGMLHVFDASTGAEVYAYVPSMLLSNLGKLTLSTYAHTYFVDGLLTAADAQISSTWKTVLVGGLGAGGKGVFALDITDPNLSAEGAATGIDKKVLWERDTSSDDDLGYTYSKPVIARLNDGKWYVVMGNGYNSANGHAVLYVIDIETGTVVKRIDTGSGTPAAPNGLSSPTLVDSNGDAKVDYAYAGDIDGNMWKFDLSGDPTAASLSYKLYAAGATQPITTAPDVTAFSLGYLVYFGTGSAFTVASLTNTDTQSIYAIYDKGTTPGTPSLVSQTLTEVTYATDTQVRWTTNNTLDWTTNTGWKIDLPGGERLLTPPVLRAERLQFVSTNPAIGDTQTNWLMEPDYLTGGSPTKTVFDLNNDGSLSTADNYNSNGDADLTDAGDVVVGWKRFTGLVSQPVFSIIKVLANNQGTVDTLFVNNLIVPYVETCSGDCVGGFVGGHMDVDTDSPMGGTVTDSSSNKSGDTDPNYTLGYKTDGHRHEYDKDMGVVYADYFDLEPRRGLISLKDASTLTQKLNRVKEVKKPDGTAAPFAGSKEFIVVLANADLSPGGKLIIGTKEWPVVEYQKMVTDKLIALGATRATAANFKYDADGNGTDDTPLVFTLDGIQAGGGTLRISFDNMAIISGGLHPTITGCVKGDKLPYTSVSVNTDFNKHITIVPGGASRDPSADLGYRWRNGALTLQLLDISNYTLQDKTFLPQLRDGTLVGGIHAQMYTAVGSDSSVKGTGTSGFTLSKGPSESGLLYESTLFWHFGALYKYRNNQDAACYGSSNWQAAINIERGGLTWGEYQALTNGKSAEIDTYIAALTALENYIAGGGVDEAEILRLVTAHNAAVAAVAEYVKLRGYVLDLGDHHPVPDYDNTGAGGSGGADAGAPVIVTGNPESPGDTVGPNYTPGRRSWTEIVPR